MLKCSTCICKDGCAVGSGRMEQNIGGGHAVHDKFLVRERELDFNVYARDELKPERHVNVRWKGCHRLRTFYSETERERESKGQKVSFVKK